MLFPKSVALDPSPCQNCALSKRDEEISYNTWCLLTTLVLSLSKKNIDGNIPVKYIFNF